MGRRKEEPEQIDSLEIQELSRYIERASKVVKEWPDWKQSLLAERQRRGSRPVRNGKRSLNAKGVKARSGVD